MRNSKQPLFEAAGGAYRAGFGVGSFGLFPILKGEDVVAGLELARRKGADPVGPEDGDRIAGFLPYVTMAFSECRMQDDLPKWDDSVEDMIQAAEQWEK